MNNLTKLSLTLLASQHILTPAIERKFFKFSETSKTMTKLTMFANLTPVFLCHSSFNILQPSIQLLHYFACLVLVGVVKTLSRFVPILYVRQYTYPSSPAHH